MKDFDDIAKNSGALSRILTQAKRQQERAERFEALAAPFLGTGIRYGGMEETTLFVKISSAAESMALRGRLPTLLKRLNHESEFRSIRHIQLYIAAAAEKQHVLPPPATFGEEENMQMQWSHDNTLLMQGLVDNEATDPALTQVLARWLSKNTAQS